MKFVSFGYNFSIYINQNIAMAYSTHGLITLISQIDRPNGDAVLARAKRSVIVPKIVRPLSGTVLAFVLIWLLSLSGKGLLAEVTTEIAGLVAIGIGLLTAVVNFLNDAMPTAKRHSETIAKIMAGVGLFIGLIAPLLMEQPYWVSLAGAVGGFLGMALIAFIGLALIEFLIALINAVLQTFSSPIAAPILALVALVNNRSVRKSGWTTANGTPIVVFNQDGIKKINHENEAIFVSSPILRKGGAALAAGIPLFTLAELSNSSLVNQRLEEAYSQAIQHQEFADHQLTALTEINPATGLPMVNGIGSLDVMGNSYGFDNQQLNNHSDIQHGSIDHI